MMSLQKRTERFDLAIGSTDESNIKKTLQLACDTNETYPISIRKNSGGFIVSFLRHPNVPAYLYQNVIMNIANKLKHDLTISTVIIQKKQGIIDDENLPSEITTISATKEVQAADEEDAALIKKYAEDEDYFNSFLGKQILEGDYDTFDGKKADKRTLKIMRTNRRLSNLISESQEVGKKIVKGQYTLNLEKMR